MILFSPDPGHRYAPPVPARRHRRFARAVSRWGSIAASLTLSMTACRVSTHPTEPYEPPPAASTPQSWDEVLAAPVEVDVQMVVSAHWEAKRAGLVNLRHDKARAAGLTNDIVPIVLQIGIVRHPDHGDFLIDTGVATEIAERTRGGAVRGLLRAATKKMQTVETLADIVARQKLEVAGALLTHSHFDHVLGLPDLPPETPIYVGPGELADVRKLNALLRPTMGRLMAGRDPVREIDPATTIALDPFPAVVDLLGDGSIWGIVCEGHTRGSMSWLVNTTEGPVLFVGDSSHTRWGWDNGVEPGKFTSDQALNAEVLGRLRAFVDRHPQTKVYVGHEL